MKERSIESKVSLPVEVVLRLISLLEEAGSRNNLNVDEKNSAVRLATLLKKKLQTASKKRRIGLSTKIVCKTLEILGTLLTDERLVKVLLNLILGAVK